MHTQVFGLQLAMGALGLFLGPLLLGLSRLVSLTLGVVGAAVLIRSDGATGAWAREMGAQVNSASLLSSLSSLLSPPLSSSLTRYGVPCPYVLQVSSLKTWLQSEAETRKLPDLWRTTRAKASALWATAKTEIASFDEAAGLSQRA